MYWVPQIWVGTVDERDAQGPPRFVNCAGDLFPKIEVGGVSGGQ